MFALLVGAWRFDGQDATLPLLVFVALLGWLLLQILARPYAAERDNSLETVCLLVLLGGYFVSVLPGATVAMQACVTAAKFALAVFGVWRVGVPLMQHCDKERRPMSVPLLAPE
jgi:uncharacterized protein YhhL (DUF1145 family)